MYVLYGFAGGLGKPRKQLAVLTENTPGPSSPGFPFLFQGGGVVLGTNGRDFGPVADGRFHTILSRASYLSRRDQAACAFTQPNWRPTVLKASTSARICAWVWNGVAVMRSRSVPRGTVG